jgi:hypothetical protein
VGNYCYLALPKGSVNDYHILIIPIDCFPNRLHLSKTCREELARFLHSLSEFFTKQLKMTFVLFERAIRTSNGRDHMQVQMIPFDLSQLSEDPVTIFQRKAEESRLSFQELEEGVELDDFLVSDESGPFQEYFYIEIPRHLENQNREERRRFIFIRREVHLKFPMSFGNEVSYRFSLFFYLTQLVSIVFIDNRLRHC